MPLQLSFLDSFISEIDSSIKTVFMPSTLSHEVSPADNIANPKILSSEQKTLVSSLMRVNHTGEVCAQALYRGQAFVSKDIEVKKDLYRCADEEYNHLAWCSERINQLDSNVSLINPLWYIGSFTIGAIVGKMGDSISYGFIIETEKQVINHLESHLKLIPEIDVKSNAVLKKMKEEELEHANHAFEKGGEDLPLSFKLLMKLQAKIMTTVACKI